MEYSPVRGNGILGPGRVAAIPDRVLDARLIACLLQPIGCARLNDMCVHDGTMGQMLPSTRFAVRRAPLYELPGGIDDCRNRQRMQVST